MSDRLADKYLDLLSRLTNVKKTGTDQHRAHCPLHSKPTSRERPLALRLTADKILARCHAECSTIEILAAVDMGYDDLFPEREHEHHRVRNPWPAAELLRSLAYEATVVAVAAAAINDGKTLSGGDRARVVEAASRIRAVSRLMESTR